MSHHAEYDATKGRGTPRRLTPEERRIVNEVIEYRGGSEEAREWAEEHVDSTPDQARSMGDLRDDDLGAHVARMETEGDDCLTEGPPGATGKVPTPAVIVSDDEATIQIASLLRRVTEEGGGHNFVIFEVGHCHYVQFATSCGSAVIYGEASSGRYCTPNCTCSPTAAQRARLRSLGWRPPTRRKFLNFYRWWPLITERDRQAVAETAVATLRVFGWCGELPRVKFHLDW